jgi:hypothetical protein
LCPARCYDGCLQETNGGEEGEGLLKNHGSSPDEIPSVVLRGSRPG